ncbi:MAG TPA: YhjD/YihY/BrkB family envelope integrity protein [Ktedonobacterales bacterium]|nr:YhjD/YihY/BrkB family envelope integrity protein [Ktedonobacterales bacterium]
MEQQQPWMRFRLVRWVIKRIQPLLDFWTKLNDDWVFNLAGMLAYNLLMSLFPILLLLLAAVGLILGDHASTVYAHIEQVFAQAIPGGGEIFEAVANQLTTNVGPLVIIGLVGSVLGGSNLFMVIESCFGIIFRVQSRDLIPKQLMAFGMLAFYLILAPLIALAFSLPSAIVTLVDPYLKDSGKAALAGVLGNIVAVLSAFVLFGATYLIVPNRRIRLKQVIPGTLLATVLLVPYISLFPLYVDRFLRPDNYGSVAGFAVVILIFFYYLGFILLLGAELNSWIAGRRLVGGDLAAVLQAARLHVDTANAASESAEAHTGTETGTSSENGVSDGQNRDG